MEKFPSKKQEILFASHLDDIDDLEKYGRDAPLENSERNKKDLEIVVNAIVDKVHKSNKKAVLLVTSSRIRAKETADLVAIEIKKRLECEDIKIRFDIEDNLKAPEQGEFILPEDYKAGSYFEGLKIASDIFYNESLKKEDKNVHYKYGDPVLQDNGNYKHPELVAYFNKYGESYAESMIRLLTSVTKTSKKIEKINLSTEVVIISHSFVYEIFRGLSILAKKIKDEGVIIKEGEIPNRLSEIFESRTSILKDTAYAPIDITNLGDKDLMTVLEREISFFKKNN
ncbi:MAG: hypothetical protein NTU81_01640 [Candidatus Nomurabacteria bacterium]|nr:hypothetical protein [Candidatus Nomurabacteria bacterium]